MKSRLLIRMTLLAVASLLLGAVVQGQNRTAAPETRKVAKGPIKSPTGATFNIAPSPDLPGEFHIIISDGGERVVSGTFNVLQLEVLKAIMDEAGKFAYSEEGVNPEQPATSRFSTREERSFIVDVTKSASQSQFFFTLKTEVGYLTLDAGSIKRLDKKAEGFFFAIRARIEAEIAAAMAPPSR